LPTSNYIVRRESFSPRPPIECMRAQEGQHGVSKSCCSMRLLVYCSSFGR
jgi:hypothetical protein